MIAPAVLNFSYLSQLQGGNPLVLPTAAQTPLATQAAGVMQNSIAVTQHPIPIFRQPAGVHLPHYPPNYVPYGHYFPPFYAPLPSMPQFLGNNAFPQQAQEGSVYPVQPVVAVTPTAVKFPMSQCKPAGSAGNSMHMGMTGGYGPYGTSQAGYNSISVTAAGNSTANEDLIASQSKDNNLYITGQQVSYLVYSFPFLLCLIVFISELIRITFIAVWYDMVNLLLYVLQFLGKKMGGNG